MAILGFTILAINILYWGTKLVKALRDRTPEESLEQELDEANGTESVHERHAGSGERSERPSKRTPTEAKTEVTEAPAGAQTKVMLIEAEGMDGRVQLFRDKVRITKQGFLAKGPRGEWEIPIQYLDSVVLKSGMNGGYIIFVLGGQKAKRSWSQPSPYEVNFTYWGRRSFRKLKQNVDQLISARQRPVEIPLESGREFDA